MNQDNFLNLNASPTRMRYLAALRGIVPADACAPFTYIQMGLFDPEELLCLAMANTHGDFFGIIKDKKNLKETEKRAEALGITNFHLADNEAKYPALTDFVCYASSDKSLNDKEQEEILKLVTSRLAPSGVLCWSYAAYSSRKDLLQFVTQKFTDELVPEKQINFLKELRILGESYFKKDEASLRALDKAIQEKDATSFLRHATMAQESRSVSAGAFQKLSSLGFAYVGDTDIQTNYSELVLSAQAQEILTSRQNHLFYEPAKDFALARLTRHDVWVRIPAHISDDMPTLYNSFTFGIVTAFNKIPEKIETKGGTVIDLQTPLFSALVGLMSKLPLSVGDFVSHPDGAEFDPHDVLAAIQVLVATGVAQPMRGRYEMTLGSDAQIIPTDLVKNYLCDATISTPIVRIASPILGGAVLLSAREALVLQAICRTGAVNSAGALFEELTNISKSRPALAAQIMDSAEPSTELTDSIIETVITNDATRWYAYGLMAG